MGIIYCWTNKITGKKYIGQTIHPEQRKRNHIHSAFNTHSDYYFHRTLRKRGIDNFTYEVLEETDDLLARETYWIKYYNTIWPNGYNEIFPNDMTDEIRKKISDSQKKRLANLSEEENKKWKENQSKSLMGRKQTELQKQKAREANQLVWLITHPDGKIEKIINLRKFCIDNGLGTNGQSNLVRGSYKGYKAIKENIQ